VVERTRVKEAESALLAAQSVLAGGGIIAVKGIGGCHLVCDAGSEAAVRRLRSRKQRNAKPFAIMAPTLAAAAQVAAIEPAARTLLLGRERPIVILPQRPGGGLAPAVAPGSQTVGVMLPYAPLHLLLFDGLHLSGPPLLVFTSANRAEAPIEFEDEPALQRLAELVDGFLLHDRPIAINCDDSVWQMAGAEPQLLRRSRGYTPLPLPLPAPAPPLLATGADLKNVIGVGSGEEIFLSQHIGDLGHPAAFALAQRTAGQLQRLFQIEPALIVCDSHPGYHSSRWAEELAQGKQLLRVQHHHAHAAALMAEHGVPPGEAILAFVWDGTGYGDDGAIWGGEALHCTYAACTRVAHLRYVPLPGGDAAIRKPYRAALAHLHSAGIEWANAATHMTAISPQEAHLLARQLDTGYNCVATSSMGRLIDAAAALCGMAAVVSYEAQAAIELEAQIPPALRPQPGAVAPYPFPLLPDAGSLSQWDPCPLLRALLADLQAGVAPGIIAARTLAGLAHGLLAVAEQQRRLVPGRRIGISGGVFQNRWLSQYVTALLEQAGFSLLRHRLVPANDGAIAYGQAAIASVAAAPAAKVAEE
jgi:hydrogenase maturation protein HypF